MKKRTLKEELERIHTITYGKKVLLENDLLNKLIKGGDVQMSNPVDDPVKADYVDDNVRTFLNDLKSIDHPITQQESGTMEYQKEVELLQIGLVLLGYELPTRGIDGLFGPETAAAVSKFKSDNDIINENSGSLRTTLTSLGYDEKGNELSSGGEITDELSDIVSNILKELKQTSPETKVTITSGNDQFHQGLGYNSKHTEGKAIDLTLNPYTSDISKIFTSILDSYKSKDSNFTYINEYDHPSGAATGGHFHLQYNEGVSQDKTQSSGNEMETVSPEMIQSISSELETKGITKEQLDKLVDEVNTGGGDIFTDLDIETEDGYKTYIKICDLFIKTREPNPLGITGRMMADSAKSSFVKHHKYVPPELALSQLTVEGGIGDSNVNNKPVRTRNPFNISNTDDGATKTFPTIQSAIDAYYDLIARRYLGNGKTSNDLIYNFVDKNEQRYATEGNYEDTLTSVAKQVRRISKNLENSI